MEVTKLDEGQEWVDVMGSGIRTKHIFRGEIGPAEMGTVVSCNLTGYFGDDTEHTEPFETLRDQVFVIGEMDSIPSIELTLRHSRVGDIYWLKSSYKFAYGVVGRPGLPRESLSIVATSGSAESTGKSGGMVAVLPNADLEYYIEVSGHHETAAAAAKFVKSLRTVGESGDVLCTTEAVESDCDSDDINALADTELRKECGNRWFAWGDFPKAGKAYSKGIQYAQSYLQKYSAEDDVETEGGEAAASEKKEVPKEILSVADESIKAQVVLTLIACLNNMSACHLSLKQYSKAKELCVRVLELEPSNVKALMRAAKASLALHEYEECDVCLKTVQKLYPNYPSLPTELNRLKIAKAAYAARDKEIAKNMAKNLFGDTKKVVKNENDKDKGGDKGSVKGSGSEVKSVSSGSRDSSAIKGNAVTDSTIDGKGTSITAAVTSDAITGINSKGEIIGDVEVVPDKQSKSEIDSTATSSTASTPFFTMIACSAAVLIISLFIAYYLK